MCERQEITKEKVVARPWVKVRGGKALTTAVGGRVLQFLIQEVCCCLFLQYSGEQDFVYSVLVRK